MRTGRAFRVNQVDDAILRGNLRSQFRKEHSTDRRQIALPLQHVGEPREIGLQPILFGVALGRQAQIVDHRIDIVFELSHFAAGVDLNRPGEVAFGHRGRDLGDRAHLGGEVRREQIDVAREILPCAGGAGHIRLTAKPAFDSHLSCDGRDLVGEGRKGVGHIVDRLGERRDLAFRLDRQVLLQIAAGDRRHHLHDAADLLGEIGRHDVHCVGQILPGPSDSGDGGLTAQFPFGADLARNAGHFRSESVELIDHRVDRVLQFENFSFHVDGNLAGQVAAGDRGGHFGDVSHLRRQDLPPAD